jgi:hypothetical protein
MTSPVSVDAAQSPAWFRAEHGIVSAQISEVMYDRLGRVAPVIEIPGGRASRHARPAHRPGHRDPHAAVRLGALAVGRPGLTGPAHPLASPGLSPD